MLRVGSVPYQVALPLTEGLAEDPGVQLFLAPPSELVERLTRGDLDVALASSILTVEDPRCALWREGPVIASAGPVRSVLLFLRQGLTDPSQIQTLALDSDSRTGQALTHIILQDSYGIAPTLLPPDSQDADARLRIGDPALAAAQDFPAERTLDLGEAWQALTGLPFVYAGWIGRPGFDPARASAVLVNAAERGMAKRLELAQENPFLLRYFHENIQYRLPADRIQDSLEEFGKRWKKSDPSGLVLGNPEAQAR